MFSIPPLDFSPSPNVYTIIHLPTAGATSSLSFGTRNSPAIPSAVPSVIDGSRETASVFGAP